ncbi:gluconokinase [bacterium]|nr:gluconokinase [bacterium]
MKTQTNQPIKLKNAQRPLILAIDIGTSSTRALVYDALGRPVKNLMHQVGYLFTTSQDGGVYADPKFIVDSTAECIDKIMEELGKHAGEVKAVGFDTFWHNLMGVDKSGKPTTALISWADTRPRMVVDALKQKLNPEEIHSRTGCVIHPSYLPAKLMWFNEEHNETFIKTDKWMSIGEYLYYVFFEKAVCSISMASGTGLLNQNTCKWDEKVFAVMPITPQNLSELGDMDTPLQGLKSTYAKRWPTLVDIPWFPAVGDGASSNVGTGCVAKDQLCIVMGTSGALRVCWEADSVIIPPELWVYRVDKKRFLMGGALSDGGNLRKWIVSHLGVEGGKKGVDKAMNECKPDGHGLTVLPFWAGERSTGWHENARGMIYGLNLNSSREEIVRATMESVSYRYAAVYDIFSRQNMPIKKIIASGGGFIDSEVLTQIMSDVMGLPVTQSGEQEGSARGAAILALEGIGSVRNAAEIPMPLGRTFNPNTQNHEIYKAARERQNNMYNLIAQRWWEKGM